MESYLSEGIQQAATARDQIDQFWADSWKDYAVQYALARKANDDQVALWNMMNEYNSPANQMQRFKDAGLNPMLVYQQGTPGNASSSPGYTTPNADIHPNQDNLQAASQAVGMLTNLAQNVLNLFSQGYDVEMKRNEAAFSNLEYASAARRIVGFGQGRDVNPMYKTTEVEGPDGQIQTGIPESLNPFSGNFSPIEYNVLSRLGKIPQYFTGYMTGEQTARLSKFKGDYQDWYNKTMEPLFERYQAGKATSAEVQAELDQYNLRAIEMLPPEVRGILAPVVQYLSPFLKFIFKRSTFRVKP